MKESIHKYFKVGTIQWMSFPNSAPLDSLLAIARDDYFDAVELTGYGADQDKAKAILDQSHLTVCFGAHPIELKNKLNPNALDEAERQKAEDVLKQTIDEAEYLGSKGVTFLAGHCGRRTRRSRRMRSFSRPHARCAIMRRKRT